jgi:hypothetical protein
MVAKDEEVKRNTGRESWGSHSGVTEKQTQGQKRNQKIPTVGTTQTTLVDVSTLTQGTPKPWTAEVDGTFVADPDVAESYKLHSVASAKATLLHRETSAATDPPTNGSFKMPSTCDGYDGNFEISHALAEPGGKKGKVGWTAEEKAHLIQCVIASNNAGLSGESLWTDVYPKMLARGVNRPLGGMRMTWLRELREQANIDERRRKNASKMKTAVQKRKGEGRIWG